MFCEKLSVKATVAFRQKINNALKINKQFSKNVLRAHIEKEIGAGKDFKRLILHEQKIDEILTSIKVAKI